MAQPLPNIANITAAINGIVASGNNMAQDLQAYNAHQQQLSTELSRCVNYPAAQMQLQLDMWTEIRAE
jgi:hypothetical protein